MLPGSLCFYSEELALSCAAILRILSTTELNDELTPTFFKFETNLLKEAGNAQNSCREAESQSSHD